MTNTLVVLLGPTGIGKTELSMQLANTLGSPIISSDSRQIYHELSIGTAAASAEQQARVRHYMVQNKSVHDYYNASMFESEVLDLLNSLFGKHQKVLMTGGSMMYIDAVCRGIDYLPTIDHELRKELKDRFLNEGVEPLREMLRKLDPVHYQKVDLDNTKRILKALEVSLQTGKPYSSFMTGNVKKRPFNILKIGLNIARETLYERINSRVTLMMEQGLETEARSVYEHRALNSLNTVGYKELFAYFNGEYDLDKAIELIKRNSRHYAKKQLSWFKRDKEISWFEPSQLEQIIEYAIKS